MSTYRINKKSESHKPGEGQVKNGLRTKFECLKVIYIGRRMVRYFIGNQELVSW